MTAHVVAARRQIGDLQHAQAREQAARLDTKRGAKIFKTEDIRATGAGDAAFEPASHLDEVAPTVAVLGVHVSQVASYRVFEHGQQKFQLALDDVIAPDQIDVLSRQQKSGVDSLFERRGSAAAWEARMFPFLRFA